MKNLLCALLIGLPFLFSCSDYSIKRNDLTRYGYKGPVEYLVTYKYLNYDGTLDSANFNYRTRYDYTEGGNVNFTQHVRNMSMFNQESMAVNYTYDIKDNIKTGWKEKYVPSGDSSYGTIEWLDDKHLLEKGYNPQGKVVYQIETTLDHNYVETEATVRQFADTVEVMAQKISQQFDQDSFPKYRIYENLKDGQKDTVTIHILEKDTFGNAARYTETYSGQRGSQFIIKDFHYRGE